ncbi:MAG: AlkZ family DNA glycosylase [Arenicella sp.]|nr:AlkZ family DNA glycosylase [Arenicella sp.]
MNHLSLIQARKLVLVSQGIHRETEFGVGYTGVVNTIELLSYVQIDTISVVERAHHHALWSRLKKYSPMLLNQAVAERDVFEYWSHAAAYLPMRDFRFSLPRKHAYLNGEQHWYHKNPKQMQYVKDRIAAEGELRVKDFDQQRSQSDHAWGGHKPAKMALEQLFMQGELMVSRRDGFQKVFDLSERVIPDSVDTSMPTEAEHLDHLIMRFLSSNGLGSSAEIAYLRKGFKPLIQKRCEELIEERLIVELVVAANTILHCLISPRS